MKLIVIGLAVAVLSVTPGLCEDLQINGNWTCVKGCQCSPKNRDPEILQRGISLIFTNECDQNSSGDRSGNHIQTYDWHITGDVRRDGSKLILSFSNGTDWERFDSAQGTTDKLLVAHEFHVTEGGELINKTLKEMGSQEFQRTLFSCLRCLWRGLFISSWRNSQSSGAWRPHF